MSEIWKSVPGWDFAEVSNHGHVRTWVQNGGHRKPGVEPIRAQAPRLLKPKIKHGRGGYAEVRLSERRREEMVLVHKLVLLAFVGPRPSARHVARHFPDPTPSNNALDNLCWGTFEENEADKAVQGTRRVGGSHHRAKLGDGDVLVVQMLAGARIDTNERIGACFGLSGVHVGRLLRGDGRLDLFTATKGARPSVAAQRAATAAAAAEAIRSRATGEDAESIARRLDVHPSTVRRWCCGKNEPAPRLTVCTNETE